MSKKQLFMGTAICSVLFLSACGGSGSEEVVTSKVGNVTPNNLNKELKQKFGKTVLYQIMTKKALFGKYKVSDADVKKKVEETKKQLGDKYKATLAQAGLKNEEELKEQMNVQVAIEKGVKETITEKDIKDNYKPKLKASHILVKDEKTVSEIKEKINNQEDFAELAQQHSEDTGSKEKGGELPEFGPGQMDPKFEEVAYKLKVGQVSDPVQSSYGYHVIKLKEKKELKPFAEEKDNIRKGLETKRLQDPSGKWAQKVVDDAFKKADIKINDKDLKDTFKELKK
ncbi:peptidylprolyl isomerase [Bacillus cereus]|uniref:peptidylprolyl isomerase n=1 Tax=Bacillus cereus TaxID=1396 RepID=UPI000BF75C69|nr:peptidylprolyl isomerase [Bacillus cereus]PFN14777.1 peptidylprolyl isomerase [Bacillus cereus]